MKWVFVLFVVLCVAAAPTVEAFEIDGLIEPHMTVKVGSPQAGVLATVDVERGDYVKKDQVLATLHSSVEKATVEVKKARKEFAARKKERLTPLFTKDMVAASDMDEADTEQSLAEAEFRQMTEVVNRLTIRSTVSGVVVERYLSPGEYVENLPIMKVAQIDPLNIELILPSDRYRSVKVGMKARVIPEKPVGGQYTATVTIVDRVIDAASGTFGVRLELPNPGGRIPPGLKCKVIF